MDGEWGSIWDSPWDPVPDCGLIHRHTNFVSWWKCWWIAQRITAAARHKKHFGKINLIHAKKILHFCLDSGDRGDYESALNVLLCVSSLRPVSPSDRHSRSSQTRKIRKDANFRRIIAGKLRPKILVFKMFSLHIKSFVQVPRVELIAMIYWLIDDK